MSLIEGMTRGIGVHLGKEFVSTGAVAVEQPSFEVTQYSGMTPPDNAYIQTARDIARSNYSEQKGYNETLKGRTGVELRKVAFIEKGKNRWVFPLLAGTLAYILWKSSRK